MKISADQVADNRQRVLKAALRLFQAKGFDQVGVADLMRSAGLTHGGFYNHFDSKRDLESQACALAFDHSLASMDKGLRGDGGPAAYVAGYLSPKSRDADGARCPMVAFANDAARPGSAIAESYGTGAAAYIETLAAALGDPRDPRVRAEAIFLASSLIGALSLARSLRETNPALSDEILSATRESLLSMMDKPAAKRGGGSANEKGGPKNRPSKKSIS